MSKPITGRCACGAVTYSAAAEPVLMFNCHCRDCQRATGSAFAAVLVFPRAAVTISGELRYHRFVGDEGFGVERGFCPVCGCRVASTLERLPDLVGIMAASLDDPALHRPAADLFTSSAQPWDHLPPDSHKFERGFPKR